MTTLAARWVGLWGLPWRPPVACHLLLLPVPARCCRQLGACPHLDVVLLAIPRLVLQVVRRILMGTYALSSGYQ